MKLRQAINAQAVLLAPADIELLLLGPHALGLNYHAPEAQHDRLRILWQQHEATVRAAARRRGIMLPWFVQRDEFVRTVRGEDT